MTDKLEPVACYCTTIQQDETCPVGYPSLLCDRCDGTGIMRDVELDGPELWEIVFGISTDAADEITDEQFTKIADAIKAVFISPATAALAEKDARIAALEARISIRDEHRGKMTLALSHMTDRATAAEAEATRLRSELSTAYRRGREDMREEAAKNSEAIAMAIADAFWVPMISKTNKQVMSSTIEDAIRKLEA